MRSDRMEHDFDDFIHAQQACYAQVLAELRAGEKRTHWMWFIFQQLKGLGQSETAWRFGLADLDAARAYRAHPVLGRRLVECASIVLGHDGTSAEAIFGSVDAMKLRSSMTLFKRAAPAETVFGRVLEAFFDAQADPRTVASLAQSASAQKDEP